MNYSLPTLALLHLFVPLFLINRLVSIHTFQDEYESKESVLGRIQLKNKAIIYPIKREAEYESASLIIFQHSR